MSDVPLPEKDHVILECFRQLWRYTQDSMFIMAVEGDGEFTLYETNPTSKRIMGLDDESFRKHLNMRDSSWDDDVVESLYATYQKAISARAPTIVEQRVTDDKGDPSFWHTLLVPLFDQAGKPSYICGVARNITVLKEAEKSAKISQQQSEIYNKALSRINENLEAKVYERTQELIRANSAKQRFLANVSHELRTPLTAIIGNTESLLMGECSPEEVRESASYIHSNSRHLLNLMNDVLDISKIEAGKIELEEGAVTLLALFEDVRAIMEPQAKAKKLAFDIRFAEPLPAVVKTDETRLKQILLNLTSNAVKFTEVGRVLVSVAYEGERLSVKVEDTGIGINPAIQNKLFKAFSQSDNSITRRYGGTGLGLNLSMQFAQIMGGDIQVQSELGRGSVFQFYITAPKISDELADLAGHSDRSFEQPLKRGLPHLAGRVLVAEDQPENNRLFCSILERMGLEVSSVVNGRDAVNLVSSSDPFDLILMDIQMPVMSGLDALQEIRAMNNACPVIALTANVMADDVARYRSAGFDDYISKPFELEQFAESVERNICDGRSREQVPLALGNSPAETDLKKILKGRFPEYREKIQEAWDDLNLGNLKREVHQLKGATLLFEFSDIGEACREVEKSLLPTEGTLSLDKIRRPLQLLLGLLAEE